MKQIIWYLHSSTITIFIPPIWTNILLQLGKFNINANCNLSYNVSAASNEGHIMEIDA